MDLEHPTALAERSHCLEDRPVRQAEVEDHERLGRRDSRVDHRRQLAERVDHAAEDRRAEPEIDRRIRGRRPPEFVDTGEYRPMRLRRRAGSRVIECQERRGPTERRRD